AIETLAPVAVTALFPEAALIPGLSNVMAQGLGGGVISAVQGLMQGGDMPSFLGKGIIDMLKSVIDQQTQPGAQDCADHIRSHCGNDLQDLFSDFAQKLQQCALENMRNDNCQENNGHGGKKISWYEALAKALGSALDAQTDKIEALSKKIGALNDQ